jgi:hypothetical protein
VKLEIKETKAEVVQPDYNSDEFTITQKQNKGPKKQQTPPSTKPKTKKEKK